MDRRAELSTIFREILGSDNTYFQPPSSIQMKYPAIVYSRARLNNIHADDSVYKQELAYTVTVIDSNPDSEIVQKVAQLPLCRFDRHFTSDNLNHDVFTLYF